MKKKKIVLFVFLIIGILGMVFIYNKKVNLNKNKLVNKSYAIYVKENNSSSYTNSKSIPKGSYLLNKEKSFCENNGEISSYDNVNGVVGFSFIGSDRCTLYFDEDSIAPTINNLTVNETILSATLSDNNNLVGYGLSTSNNIEPTSWTQITGTTYNLNITIESEGTYYLWVKDSAGNKTIKEFTISLEKAFETLMVANNTDIFEENGIRYEGANPNNYICLDNQKSGGCSSSSLLFRIIGLFDEDTSSDGTNSSGTKKLLKVLDTNNYGGTDGKVWNSNATTDWSTASLKLELNDTYMTTLTNTSNINSKLANSIINTKWYLGEADNSNYNTINTVEMYNKERNANFSSIYAKIGLMYPSDFGYATVGGSTVSGNNCKTYALRNLGDTSYSDCKNNNWIFLSANFLNSYEWLLSPYSTSNSNIALASGFSSTGAVNVGDAHITGINVNFQKYAVRPTFYLDSENLKIVGGDGSSSNPYHIG